MRIDNLLNRQGAKDAELKKKGMAKPRRQPLWLAPPMKVSWRSWRLGG
jgi:hypothetical protein